MTIQGGTPVAPRGETILGIFLGFFILYGHVIGMLISVRIGSFFLNYFHYLILESAWGVGKKHEIIDTIYLFIIRQIHIRINLQINSTRP